MCEFCHKHGEGEKWYLKAQNYSDDLLNDLNRRQYIQHFIGDQDYFRHGIEKMEKLRRLPSYVRAVITPIFTERQKRNHWGQVVPIEEIERIFSFVNSVIRLPCLCRQTTMGREQRYCYALSMVPFDQSKLIGIVRDVDPSYLMGPDTHGLENMQKNEALDSIKDLEKIGFCHTIWTFISPFIGAICNCDRKGCVAMRAGLNLDYPMMFVAEYIAQISSDLCNGCRQCVRVCQFGAMVYNNTGNKVMIDQKRCYGCGICRANCPQNAIKLKERFSRFPHGAPSKGKQNKNYGKRKI